MCNVMRKLVCICAHTCDVAALGKMLSLCAYHPSALLKTSSALMGCSVEKECKLDVMRYAGFEMITLLRVSVYECPIPKVPLS